MGCGLQSIILYLICGGWQKHYHDLWVTTKNLDKQWVKKLLVFVQWPNLMIHNQSKYVITKIHRWQPNMVQQPQPMGHGQVLWLQLWSKLMEVIGHNQVWCNNHNPSWVTPMKSMQMEKMDGCSVNINHYLWVTEIMLTQA